jgi:hypothetical protein
VDADPIVAVPADRRARRSIGGARTCSLLSVMQCKNPRHRRRCGVTHVPECSRRWMVPADRQDLPKNRRYSRQSDTSRNIVWPGAGLAGRLQRSSIESCRCRTIGTVRWARNEGISDSDAGPALGSDRQDAVRLGRSAQPARYGGPAGVFLTRARDLGLPDGRGLIAPKRSSPRRRFAAQPRRASLAVQGRRGGVHMPSRHETARCNTGNLQVGRRGHVLAGRIPELYSPPSAR